MFLCLVSVEMKWLLPPPAVVVVVVVAAAAAVAVVEVVLMVAKLAEVAVLAGSEVGVGAGAGEAGSLLAAENVSGCQRER
jgi:hypothetical protein